MQIETFQLERYFAKYEFSTRYLLSSSDCEALSLSELLSMADDETFRMWQELKLGYTVSQGHPRLRQTIAGIYEGLEAEHILEVVPQEGIFLLSHALLKPGDHVVCTFPGYQSLYEVARSIGCEVSTWEPHEKQGWRFALEDLKELMRDNTKLVVVNFPHNPTGYLPTKEDFLMLVELLGKHVAYLLSDEMYRFLEIAPGRTLPAACELYERAISLFGLSKTFGLPGLRMGWLASQDRHVLQEVNRLKDYTTICGSAPGEILSIIALRNRFTIIQSQLKRVRRNIQILDQFFVEYQEFFSWKRPLGSSICFPRLLLEQNSYEFCEQVVQEAGILLAPSRMFQFGDQHLRIGFGRENFPRVIQLFAEYLDEQCR